MKFILKLIPVTLIATLLSVSSFASAQLDVRVFALAWNPAGTILAASGRDTDGGGLWFYDIDGQLIDQINVFSSVLSVSWSPDGSKIAGRTVGSPDEYMIWDVDTKTVLSRFEDSYPTDNYFVYWNPDGDRLATVASVAVLVRDSTSGDIISTLFSPGSHTDAVQSVAWNADGSKLFVASADNVVRVWDVATATILSTFPLSYLPSAMVLSPDGTEIAVTADRMVEIRDAETGTLLSSFQPLPSDDFYRYVSLLKWHPDGSQIASASSDNIQIWDLETSTTIALFPQIDRTRSYPEAMDYSIDGKFAYMGEDGHITIIDSSQLQTPINNHADT